MFVFFSKVSPLARSDIIILEYIVEGKLISTFAGDETIALQFSNKLTEFDRSQVS